MFEELRYSTKLPYLRNERCTTVLNLLFAPKKSWQWKRIQFSFGTRQNFSGATELLNIGGCTFPGPSMEPCKKNNEGFFFWIPGRNINLFETSLKELCWAKRTTNSRDIFSANPVNPVDWWVCTFQNTNLHPFTRWSGCFAGQTLFPNRDRSKKSSHGHHLSPCHLNNEEIQLHVFANFFPGKRLAKLLCFSLPWIIGSKSHCQNGNAWNPMQIPKHKNAMGVLGWRMISCDCFVQKQNVKKNVLKQIWANPRCAVYDVQIEPQTAASYCVLKLSYPVRSNKKGTNLLNRYSTKWFNGWPLGTIIITGHQQQPS